MMFVDSGYFTTLLKRTDSQLEEVLQQYKRTVDNWMVGLRVFGVHINPEKLFWYPIQWVCIYGRPNMLTYENTGYVYLYKRYGEQAAIEKNKLTTIQKGDGSLKNILEDKTKNIVGFQKKHNRTEHHYEKLIITNKECVEILL